MSITGRNWGNATLDGATMMFAVGSKPAFRIPLKDVNQVQQNKEEVCKASASQAPQIKLRMCMSRINAGHQACAEQVGICAGASSICNRRYSRR